MKDKNGGIQTDKKIDYGKMEGIFERSGETDKTRKMKQICSNKTMNNGQQKNNKNKRNK